VYVETQTVGSDITDGDSLELGDDPVRARNAAVVERVPGVPTGAAAADLHDPRPDLSRVAWMVVAKVVHQ
jgi:hypothetical protein